MTSARSAKAMAFATLTSRGLGFVKATLLILAIGGTSSNVGGQAFDVAISVPMQLYGFIAGGVLGAILVPQIVVALHEGKDGAERLDRLLTATVVVGGLITVAATLAAPILVWIYAAKWSAEWLGLATTMAYWCIPQIFFFIVYAVIAQMLNAREVFGLPAWAPALSNVVAIIGIGIFMVVLPSGLGDTNSWNPTMIAVLCGTATLGVALQALILIRPLRNAGFDFRIRWGVKGLGNMSRVAFWAFLGVASGQFAYVAVSNVAANAGQTLNSLRIVGPSINSYSSAYLLVLVPHAVATVSLATAMFTRMSRSSHERDFVEVERNLRRTNAMVMYVTFGVTAVFLVAGPLITQVLWQTPVIGTVVQPLALGLVGFGGSYIVGRASYAMKDAVSPFITQALIAVVSTVGAIMAGVLLPPQLVVLGVASAVSVANLAGWGAAHVLFIRRLRANAPTDFGKKPDRARGMAVYVRMIIATVLASAVGFVVANLVGAASLNSFVSMVVVVGVVGVIYTAAAWLLGDRHLNEVAMTLRRR